MKTIIQQQIELALGDEYKDTAAKASNFVKGLISKKHWWVDRNAMLESEGPLSRMTEQCLLSIIEKGETKAGYKAYVSYLSNFYGSGYSKNKNIPLADEVATEVESTFAPAVGIATIEGKVDQAPLDEIAFIQQHLPESKYRKRNPETYDFIIALASTRNVVAAGNLLGWHPSHAWDTYRNLRRTARNQAQNGPSADRGRPEPDPPGLK